MLLCLHPYHSFFWNVLSTFHIPITICSFFHFHFSLLILWPSTSCQPLPPLWHSATLLCIHCCKRHMKLQWFIYIPVFSFKLRGPKSTLTSVTTCCFPEGAMMPCTDEMHRRCTGVYQNERGLQGFSQLFLGWKFAEKGTIQQRIGERVLCPRHSFQR